MSELRPRGVERKLPPQVRHGRLPRRTPYGFIGKLIAAIVSVAVVSGLGIAGVAAADVFSGIGKGVHLDVGPGHTQVALPPNVGAISGGVNLLLVGSDTRTAQGGEFSDILDQEASTGAGNNDVTILLHIAANHQSATVVSFPRDTVLPIPECPDGTGGYISAQSAAMINTTLAEGGLSCVVDTVESLTGLTDIPFAAEISFDGVAAMANAVGGVTVCVATPIVDPYTGLDLTAGYHSVDGYTALAFLRTRHGVGDGSDLGRISNQQVYLSALMRTITSDGVLGNPIKLYQLAKAATENMKLSDTLTNPTTLVQIAVALKSVPLQNVSFVQYPVLTDPTNANRVIPDPDAGAVLDNALVKDLPVKITGTVGRGSVTNPTPTSTPGVTSTTKPTKSPSSTSTSTPTPTKTPTSTPTSTAPASAVPLPSSVPGQTASEQTCSKGQDG